MKKKPLKMFVRVYLFFCLTTQISFNLFYCSPTKTNKYINSNQFLSLLPDRQLLYNLALVGTYQSASVHSSQLIKTQNLVIRKQLELGVRVLDIQLRLEDNELKLYYGPVLLDYSLDEVFEDIFEFMIKNSRELVIMIMKIEGKLTFSDLMECQVVNEYIKKWETRGLPIVGNWSLLEDNIGEHRGHVLLSHVNSQDFASCITYLPCEVQNDWFIIDLENRWHMITDNHDKMLNAYYPYHSCYVNYLSSLNPLLFIHVNSLSQDNTDVIELRFKQIAEINHRMAKYFRNPENTLAIIMTEFPSQDLIDNIISSNFD